MPAKREPWLVTLESAKTTDDLLATLPNADASTLQGLLRRHQLADPGLQVERVEAIKKALEEGAVSSADLFTWRDDVLTAESAIDGIGDFRKKHVVIEAFRREHNEATKGNFVPAPGKDRVVLDPGKDSIVLENIRREIWRENLPLSEWVEFLDARRDETDRHIFLFRLPHVNFPHVAVTQEFTWKPEQPVLKDWQVDAQQNVRLKWVGWRAPFATNARGRRIVSFAVIHPERRTMELCIQRLRGGGMQAVLDERDAYTRQAVAQLKMRPEAVRLEPAIRELLKNKRLDLKHWMVRTPKGGELSGKGEPGLFEQIRLGFDRYYALELKGTWTADPKMRVEIRMDARTDAIEVRTQCSQTALTDLISTAWDNIDNSPAVTAKVTEDPETFKDDHEANSGREQLEKLVEYLTRLGEPLPLRRPPKEKRSELKFATKTRKDLRFSAKTVEDALQQFGVRAVGLTLYIMCPDTVTPASRDGQVIEFDRPGDIPEEIECDNTGAVRRHHTEDNVWLKVGPPVGGSHNLFRWIWICISVYFALLTVLFVWMTQRYPGARPLAFLVGGFLLSALAPIAAIHRIYGPDAFKAAGDLVRWLLDAVLSKRRSEAEEQDSGAHDGNEAEDTNGDEVDEDIDEDERE
jgi:hypothetical protein